MAHTLYSYFHSEPPQATPPPGRTTAAASRHGVPSTLTPCKIPYNPHPACTARRPAKSAVVKHTSHLQRVQPPQRHHAISPAAQHQPAIGAGQQRRQALVGGRRHQVPPVDAQGMQLEVGMGVGEQETQVGGQEKAGGRRRGAAGQPQRAHVPATGGGEGEKGLDRGVGACKEVDASGW